MNNHGHENAIPPIERAPNLSLVPPELQCLAWHNYLKRLANEYNQNLNYVSLEKELREYENFRGDTSGIALLYQESGDDLQKRIQAGSEELKLFLEGKFQIHDSKDGELVPNFPGIENVNRQHSLFRKSIDALLRDNRLSPDEHHHLVCLDSDHTDMLIKFKEGKKSTVDLIRFYKGAFAALKIYNKKQHSKEDEE